MPNLRWETISGTITLIILLSSGATLYVIDDPNRNYGTCSEGWKLQEDGTYSCISRSITGEYCYSTTATRCYYGIKIKTEEPKYEIIKSSANSWVPKEIKGEIYWVKIGVSHCYKDGLIDQKIENCQVET